mgnify:CR=1 FL=1|tara:strand:+ start:467 stop:1441 length:975 start_codon:yes stop_codon:yes gene_type:complete
MTLNIKIPDISKQIYKKDVHQILQSNFNEIVKFWWIHQLGWINSAYLTFKDHEKFLIAIYLQKKTLEFYSRHFVKISYDDFYAKTSLEIEKFNIVEIAKDLELPKETARRKILELEKIGFIRRQKKKIILDRSVFPSIKPNNSTKRMAEFLSKFSKILKKYSILNNYLDSEDLLKYIHKNFSYCWKLFYDLQLPIIMNWKKHFKEIECWHIWGLCILNKSYNPKFQSIENSGIEFIEHLVLKKESLGLNAMTISDMTGIPRATVVRKLKILLDKNYLKIDEKKHYHPSNDNFKTIQITNRENINNLAKFTTDIFNQYLGHELRK